MSTSANNQVEKKFLSVKIDFRFIKITNMNVELTTNPSTGEIDISDAQAINLRQSLETLSVISIQIDKQTLGDGANHLDAIPETYQKISDAIKTRGGRFPSPQSIQEFLDASAMVDKKTAGITQPYIFAKIIESTGRLFAESQDLAPTHKEILNAFYSCVDCVRQLSQEKIDLAIEDASNEPRTSKAQVIQEIQTFLDEPENSTNIPTEAKTKAQVIGFILRTFKYRISRASISDKKLADWVETSFQKYFDKVGGASAQATDFLTGIGEENCTVYTEYNSPDQAKTYKNLVKFLHFSEKGMEIHPITDNKSINPTHPIRKNYPIKIPAKTKIKFNGQTIESRDITDRIIFTTKYFDQNGNTAETPPIFHCSDTELKQIASKYEYIIINGIQYLQKYSPELYQQTVLQITKQLNILKSFGVKTHYEISGNTTGRLSYLKDVVKGKFNSMGTGHEELYEVVSELQKMGEIPEIYQGKDAYSIYQNAVALASYLELDRLYVHGHSVDLVVRKGITQNEQLETEVRAMYHTKQRVVEWLTGQESTQKTPKDRKLSPELKREGLEELAEFGRQVTANLNTSYKDRARVLKQIYSNGYYRQAELNKYSFAIIPVKWIYIGIKDATSIGDIGSYGNFVQSGL